MAPPLAGSPRVNGHRDYVIKALLHGMTGPSTDKTYTRGHDPDGRQNDEWIAAIASYVRNSFGNTGVVRHAGRRRARARRDGAAARRPGRSPSSKRRCRAAAGAADVEADRQPQRRGGRERR